MYSELSSQGGVKGLHNIETSSFPVPQQPLSATLYPTFDSS
jgi:hypothetical protein